MISKFKSLKWLYETLNTRITNTKCERTLKIAHESYPIWFWAWVLYLLEGVLYLCTYVLSKVGFEA
jgi:hypothetical protein